MRVWPLLTTKVTSLPVIDAGSTGAPLGPTGNVTSTKPPARVESASPGAVVGMYDQLRADVGA